MKAFDRKIYGGIIIVLVIVAILYNSEIFAFINGLSNPVLDIVMLYFTHLGDGLTATLVALLIWLYRPKRGFVMVASLILVGIFVPLLKAYFDMPRPTMVIDNVRILGRTLRHHSFPSGHSATAVAYGCALATFLKSWKMITLYILATIAAISRIYVGVHFPVDVAAGIAAGFICVLIVLAIEKKYSDKWTFIKNPITILVINILLVIIAAIALLFYNPGWDYLFFEFAGTFFMIWGGLLLFRRFSEKSVPE